MPAPRCGFKKSCSRCPSRVYLYYSYQSYLKLMCTNVHTNVAVNMQPALVCHSPTPTLRQRHPKLRIHVYSLLCAYFLLQVWLTLWLFWALNSVHSILCCHLSSKTTCSDGIACYQKLAAVIGPPKLKYKQLNIYF